MGSLVKYLEETGKNFQGLTLDEIKKINPIFNEEALEYFKLEKALFRKKSEGSPNPEMVKKQLKRWKSRLAEVVED